MDQYIKRDNQVYVKHGNYSYNLFPVNSLQEPNFRYGLFCRYLSDLDNPRKTEWYYVVKDEKEDLQSYSSKKRNKIKKGLKNCGIQKTTANNISDTGYPLYKKWNESFGNKYLTSLEFKKQIQYESNLDLRIDYFLVKSNKSEKIGYSKNFILENEKKIAFYETIVIDPEYKNRNINYALIYYMNYFYLTQNNFDLITNGSRNIFHETNIQNFLIENFGYRKTYCKLNILYHPAMKKLFSIMYPFFSVLKKVPNNSFKALLKQEEIRRSCL